MSGVSDPPRPALTFDGHAGPPSNSTAARLTEEGGLAERRPVVRPRVRAHFHHYARRFEVTNFRPPIASNALSP